MLNGLLARIFLLFLNSFLRKVKLAIEGKEVVFVFDKGILENNTGREAQLVFYTFGHDTGILGCNSLQCCDPFTNFPREQP